MNAFIQQKIKSWPRPDVENFIERAAIMEYLGEMSREQAEISAFRLVAPMADVADYINHVDQMKLFEPAPVSYQDMEWL